VEVDVMTDVLAPLEAQFQKHFSERVGFDFFKPAAPQLLASAVVFAPSHAAGSAGSASQSMGCNSPPSPSSTLLQIYRCQLFDEQAPPLADNPLLQAIITAINQQDVNGFKSMADQLLTSMVSPSVRTATLRVCFLLACFLDEVPLVQAMLQSHGGSSLASTRSKTVQGWNALHIAASIGSAPLTRCLLEYYCDAGEQSSASAAAPEGTELLPLHLAAVYGHLEVVQLLQPKGGERTAGKVCCWDHSCMLNPLQTALVRGHHESFLSLASSSNVCAAL
jgi:ankyrin repeat protein